MCISNQIVVFFIEIFRDKAIAGGEQARIHNMHPFVYTWIATIYTMHNLYRLPVPSQSGQLDPCTPLLLFIMLSLVVEGDRAPDRI